MQIKQQMNLNKLSFFQTPPKDVFLIQDEELNFNAKINISFAFFCVDYNKKTSFIRKIIFLSGTVKTRSKLSP